MVAQLEGIIFDLDNTLVDRQDAMTRWLKGLISRMGQPPERHHELIKAALNLDAFGYSERAPFCEALAKLLVDGERNLSAATIWQTLREELGACVEPIIGLELMLKQLGQRYTLAILSNGSSANQRLKLAHSGVLTSFEPAKIIISAELGLEKPDARAFKHMSTLMNTSPARLLFVGDHPIADIYGAQRAGMKTAWLRMGRAWPAHLPRPDYTLNTLLELGPHLIQRGEHDR